MKFLIALIITSNIFANLSGEYFGEGYFYSATKQGTCHEVFFSLKETPTSFEIVTGGYNCSSLSAEYPNSKFEKHNGILFYQGERVGSYGESGISLSYYDGLYKLLFHKYKNELLVIEKWEDAEDFLVIKSSLFL